MKMLGEPQFIYPLLRSKRAETVLGAGLPTPPE